MTRLQVPYVDPLDLIWLSLAKQLGLQVVRDAAVYASYDGKGKLSLAPPSQLDPDDCLAQMILHEICHALVQGEASWQKIDWGLFEEAPTEKGPDFSREHGCLRLQAALLRPYALDHFLAPTTEFRAYYDALPENPMHGEIEDGSIALAQAGLALAGSARYRRVLNEALRNTAILYKLMQSLPDSTGEQTSTLWNARRLGSLHPSGFSRSVENAQHTCHTCMWFSEKQCQKAVLFFQGEDPLPIEDDEPCCVLYEPKTDCRFCAACCRHGYDLVPISPADSFLHLYPNLVEMSQVNQAYVQRVGQPSMCAALRSSTQSYMPFYKNDKQPKALPLFSCTVYADRPQACKELEPGSEACLIARKRVGLSI